MKMRFARNLLWIAVLAVVMMGAFPQGAAAGCGQRCIGISSSCSVCGVSAPPHDGCIQTGPCACVNVTCPVDDASADSALALLVLTPQSQQTVDRCPLQEPAALGG
jgi:hypothetical protein